MCIRDRVFIEQFLGLGTYGYAWYFVPTIVGMTVGSALSARLAAQTSPARCTNIGLLVMIAGQAINLAYNAVTEHPAVPWAVLPFAIYGCGVSLATPPMNVATLDRHPLHRGAAASVQSAMWSLMMVFVNAKLFDTDARQAVVDDIRSRTDAFASATGYYRSLPAEIRAAQIDRIADLCDQLYPSLRLCLFDARRVFSAPVTVFGPLLAVIYLGRSYIAFRDALRVQSMTEHFDWLVREADVGARDAARHLRALKPRL